jgi:hypothetical protein
VSIGRRGPLAARRNGTLQNQSSANQSLGFDENVENEEVAGDRVVAPGVVDPCPAHRKRQDFQR